jgi:glutamate--cysteine ligase
VAPSFEPGGQLELSPAPRPTAAALVRDLDWMLRRAAAIASARGVRLETAGLNPYHSCADVPLRLRTPRYLAMQQVFDESGPDGRRMMRLTASLQITIDLLPGRAGQEQWLVANLAGPPLAAAFANSGSAEGRPAGLPGARTRIWQNVDLRRTGYDGRHLDLADPVGAYAAFAAAAPRLPIRAAGRPSYHLSTLFPPVRPRGHFELRMIDAQPGDGWVVPVAVVSALLSDAQAADAAAAAAERLWHPDGANGQDPWLLAASVGPAHPRIARASRECFAAARDALVRQHTPAAILAAVDDFIERYVSKDRCPADDLLEELR